MRVQFTAKLPRYPTDNNLRAIFTLRDDILVQDIENTVSYHKRLLDRNSSSAIQKSFLRDALEIQRLLGKATAETVIFTTAYPYLSQRYSHRIAQGDFSYTHCPVCDDTTPAQSLSFEDWEESSAKGKNVFCVCGERLWLHFETMPR